MNSVSLPLKRLCFSGDATCAGLSPCEFCRYALATEIIGHALKAAGCDSAEQVEAFFTTYNASKATFLETLAKQLEALQQAETALASKAPEVVPEAKAPPTPTNTTSSKTKAKTKGARTPTPSPESSDAAKPRHEHTTQKAGTTP